MKEITKYTTKSEAETINLGQKIAADLEPFSVIAFYGDLGVGKTHFISGIAKGLGYKGEVSSPTYAIVNEYNGGRLNLYHFDMYRIDSWEDLESVSFFDYLDMGGVTAIEWSENIENALPEDTIRITIRYFENDCREITIER